jgi:tetratricopeptide (TPR) repeat protein
VLKAICTMTIFSSIAAGIQLLMAQSPADHIHLGIAANEARDPQTAIQHFQAALSQDSTSYEANWRASLTLLDLVDLLPDSLRRARRDSMYTLAERYATRAVASDSTQADGHFALAAAVGTGSLLKSQKERIRRAGIIRREAIRAIQINPRHDGAYHILGRWNAEIMRLSGFNRFFARSFLGAGIFKEASWDSATADLEKAVELDPGRIYHRLELAEVYVDRKRYGDARRELAALDSLPVRELRDSAYKAEGDALAKRIADKR